MMMKWCATEDKNIDGVGRIVKVICIKNKQKQTVRSSNRISEVKPASVSGRRHREVQLIKNENYKLRILDSAV